MRPPAEEWPKLLREGKWQQTTPRHLWPPDYSRLQFKTKWKRRKKTRQTIALNREIMKWQLYENNTISTFDSLTKALHAADL